MEIFHKNKKFQIDFTVNKPMEFLQAMFIIGNKDYLIDLSNELNYELDQTIIDKVNQSRNKLSRFSQQELNYFFGYKDMIGYACFEDFAFDYPEVNTVTDMIGVIENSQIDIFIKNMLDHAIRDCSDENNIIDIDYKNICIKEILVKINDTKVKGLKDKIIEILENPTETKQRFCLLLKQFYEKVYQESEDETINLLEIHKDKYEKIFKENPQQFFRQYLKRDIDSDGVPRVVFHVSYWLQYGVSFTYTSKLLFIAIGLHIDKFYGKKAVKERMQKFFKILSDKKRIDIIDTLGIRPHYVQEIAEKLDLTAATISYHLNFLYELDLVKNTRQDHRLYYSLNREKVKELFNEAMSVLLHE